MQTDNLAIRTKTYLKEVSRRIFAAEVSRRDGWEQG